MKKFFSSLLFSSLLFILSNYPNGVMAQSNWSLTGNEPGSGELIGTTNESPFVMKNDKEMHGVMS